MVWPLRSRVMLLAPITMPLLGQLTRSLSRVVSVVMVSPHLTWLASAGPLARTLTPATTSARTSTLESAAFGDERKGSFRASRDETNCRLDMGASPVTAPPAVG